jgi:hypothetical protein
MVVASRWRMVSGLLFVAAVALPVARDLFDVLVYLDDVTLPGLRTYAGPDIRHFAYHMLSPILGLSAVGMVTLSAILLVGYRRGEVWAWWALALAGLIYAAVKAWASLGYYPHWHAFDWLMLGIWIAAAAMSVKDGIGRDALGFLPAAAARIRNRSGR